MVTDVANKNQKKNIYISNKNHGFVRLVILSRSKVKSITVKVSVSETGIASHNPLSPTSIGRRMKLGMTNTTPRSSIHKVARLFC